jgi:hypothetical protein
MKTRTKRPKGKPTSRQISQRLENLEKAFERFRNLQELRLKALAKTLVDIEKNHKTIFANQKELSKSATRLDEQFCVQGRLFITAINEILHRANSDEIITYEAVNLMFMEWEKFRSRPDFREHMKPWFMGDDLDSLPPPPEPKQEETPEETPDAEVEGPQEFGGDYAEGSGLGNEAASQEQSEGKTDSSPDEVPEGQDADEATRQAPAVS